MKDGSADEGKLGGTRKHNPFLDGCRHVSAFRKGSRISEGTYGIVWKAVDKET